MTVSFWPTLAEATANAAHTAAAPLSWDPATHLLSRLTYGATVEDRARLAALGPDAWFAEQVEFMTTYRLYKGHPDIQAQSGLCRKTPYDLRQYLKNHGNEYGWDAMDRLTQVTMGLQIFSKAQLHEVLVDVMSNHLHVPNHFGDVWNTRADYDRTVIRKYITGTFADMLVASSKHPAMLRYLSLCDSTKYTINENYARELLELHTVGMHYSESDVKGAARILTGRTMTDYQNYTYDDYIHATGAVKVLGFSDPNTKAARGEAAGDAMLRYLAGHQFTAQNIATKLCRRLVSDSPSAELISAVAQAYLDNGTQIIPTVRKILCSTEFWESRGKKVRRPAENIIGAARVLGAQMATPAAAIQTLQWMGNAVGNSALDWQAPNGYPDVQTSWRSSSALLQEWDYHLGFIGQWAGGFQPGSVDALYGGVTPTTVGQAIDLLTTRLTGTVFTPDHRQALLTFLGDTSFDTTMARSGIRWYAMYLVGVILHSPYHALR